VLVRDIKAYYSKNRTEHKNMLREQNSNVLVLRVAVFIETTMGRPKTHGVSCRYVIAEARV
jgi:hypothetical protein